MKILSIRFQNLNSLTGIWEIDFTDPAYAENSLFAITGPTGAGKSTLLDAICLALYGATPRLAKITKTSNEIMSRHTGSCFAEVAFSTTKGTFRCHWSQHRSRQKPHGELQQPKHEIADAISNNVLESRMRKVANRVETVTGMDFDRFTRSTLLAQGGFAAFLQASADKRAPILEQITGTEIYSRLSMKVHELFIGEQKKLDELEQHLSHINLLPQEEEEELQNILILKEKEVGVLKIQITELRQQQGWLGTIAKLTEERENYRLQLESLCKEEEKQTEPLEKLGPALAAKEIEPMYAMHQGLVDEQKKGLQESRNLEKICSGLEREWKGFNENSKKAQDTVRQAETTRETGLELIRNVQELDHTIRGTKTKLQEQTDWLAAERVVQKKEDSEIKSLLQDLNKAQEHKKLLQEFFKQQAGDEKLVEEFGSLRITLENLGELYVQHHGFAKTIHKAKEEAADKKQRVTKLAEEQNHLKREVRAAQELFGQLQQRIEQLLQGRDPASLQQELFQTRNRQRSVEELQLLLEEREILFKQLKKLKGQALSTADQAIETEQEISTLDKDLTAKHQEIELLKKNLLLLARIQTLEEERAQLKDGTPCPLCGSITHPYNQGNIPAHSQEEARLEKAKTELKAITEKNTQLTKHLIQAKEKQSMLSRHREETEERLRSTKLHAEQLLSDLEFPALAAIDLQQVKGERLRLNKDQGRLEQNSSLLEKLNKEFQSAGVNKEELTIRQQKLDTKSIDAAHQASSADKEVQTLLQQAKKLSNELHTCNNDLSQRLSLYAIHGVREETLSLILQELRCRREAWKGKKEEETRITPQLLKLRADLTHKQELSNKRTTELQASEKSCQLTRGILDDVVQKRSNLFGDKETTLESNRLEQVVKDSRKAYDLSLDKCAATEKELTASQALHIRLQTEYTERTVKIKRQKELVHKAISDSIFSSLEQFLEARITTQELETLQRLHDELQSRKTELKTLHKDKTAALKLEQEKQFCKALPAELNKQLHEQEKQLEALQETTITAREQLKKNAACKTQSAEQLTAIASQKEEVGRWNRLHMLIGSADGKKFRNFAQGLTFEMMTHHANAHLAKMNNRYILVRDKTHPLDLNVIDTFQADEIRSTKNLSGGESFLVSLALALGLSRMASQNVRVDSLFLDEGFGTLDEEALESALETLAQLREENKLIGIISHVGALKERVPLQIEIIPGNRGQSSIKGPGVTMEPQ